jgi:hypothetical protein
LEKKGMSDQLETQLRKVLEPVDPGDLFVSRVVARLPDQPVVPAPVNTVRRRVWRWVPVALAASLVGGVLVRHEMQLRQELEEGRVAREQLLEALRVTSEKLDVAYRAVHSPRERRPQEKPDTTI